MKDSRITNYFSIITAFLGSSRLAIVISVLLLVVFLLGILVPQKGRLSPQEYELFKTFKPYRLAFLEKYRLMEIYSSWPVFILFGALFLNMTVCMANRWKAIWKRCIEKAPQIPTIRREGSANSLPILKGGLNGGKDFLQLLRKGLSRRGFRTYPGPEGDSIWAVKNRWTPMGSVVFHLSFLVMLVGAIVSSGTRFSGIAVLAEGQPFSGQKREYLNTITKKNTPEALPKVEFIMSKLSPNYNTQGRLVDLAATLSVPKKEGRREVVVRMNRPYREGATSVLLNAHGVTPLWVLRDNSGRELDGAFVNLMVLQGREDRFNIPKPPYTVIVRFFPDYAEGKDGPTTRSLVLNNPIFQIEVIKDEPGVLIEKPVFSGLIRPGEPARFDGYSLAFPEIRYWAQFLIVRDYGIPILFAGFVVAILGLLWRLVFSRREMVAWIVNRGGSSELHWVEKSDYYPHLFAWQCRELVEGLMNQEKR